MHAVYWGPAKWLNLFTHRVIILLYLVGSCFTYVNKLCTVVLCCTGLSVEFAQALFRVWLQEKDVQNIAATLKRSGVESKLMVCMLGILFRSL
jgi:hypothetical protein